VKVKWLAVVNVIASLIGFCLVGSSAAQTNDWSGFYAGASLGSRTATSNWKTCRLPLTISCGNPSATLWANDNNASLDSTGVKIAGMLGINLQAGNWVFGVESDVGWGDNKESRKGIPGALVAGLPNTDVAEVKQTWDTSLRARAGYLVTPTLLLYGTGGVAWIRKEVTAVCANLFINGTNGNWCVSQTGRASVSETPVGWTVGSGLEWMFAPRWTVRGEYRFSKFAGTTATFFKATPIDALRVTSTQKTHIANIGVAYLFNLP